MPSFDALCDSPPPTEIAGSALVEVCHARLLEVPQSLIFFSRLSTCFGRRHTIVSRSTLVATSVETPPSRRATTRQVRHLPTFILSKSVAAEVARGRICNAPHYTNICYLLQIAPCPRIKYHTIVRYPTVMYSSSTAESGSQDQGIARKQHEPVLDLQLRCDANIALPQCHRCVAPQQESG